MINIEFRIKIGDGLDNIIVKPEFPIGEIMKNEIKRMLDEGKSFPVSIDMVIIRDKGLDYIYHK